MNINVTATDSELTAQTSNHDQLPEFTWIARYFRPLAAGFSGSFNLCDDAALVSVPDGFDQVVTSDALVAGTHFFADDAAKLIAKKALRTNLSDLAAKGAKPFLYNLCLALPKNITEDWIADFCQGLGEDQREFGIDLLGGDTVAVANQRSGEAGALMVAITAIGLVPRGTMLRRNGAVPGDEIWVTGTIGDAALGLDLISQSYKDIELPSEFDAFLRDRYYLPRPRLGFATPEGGISAGLDISDGLWADFSHMARQSRVDIEIDLEFVPLSPAAQQMMASGMVDVARLLNGGDDYELAFSAPAKNHGLMQQSAARTGIKITRIGRALAPHDPDSPQCRILDRAGGTIPLAHSVFRHF